jgi:two-component system, CAI-1 autoinducer sensor kinase/phosphatase CqsS
LKIVSTLAEIFHERIMSPEMEIILHPSRRRLQWLGVFTILGHLLFWWVWSDLLPQKFEDWQIRIVMAATGLGLIFIPARQVDRSLWVKFYFSMMCWLQLPFFFIWMYWMNASAAVWMASVAVIVVVYYQLTDWRAATLGLLSGLSCATALAHSMLDALIPVPLEHVVLFLFSWVSAILLALSSANLRRERLRHSLNVIGIMAHELRTPLATLALIAQAVRSEAAAVSGDHAPRLEDLANRVDALTRAVNHHIDLQMANARYTHQPQAKYLMSAHELVKHVLENYPYGSSKERHCIQVILHSDFYFHGSPRLFNQVLNNLLKNAMFSLKTAQSRYAPGDVRIELGHRDKLGRIQISDQGVGINPSQIRLIFEPFFSTSNETGHGLGLAFCKQVIDAAHGTITVHSEPAMGATFTLQLPCQDAPSEKQSSHHEVSPVSPA